MAEKSNEAPRNSLGITDPHVLEQRAGSLATNRIHELEKGEILTSFTREDLLRTHEYILQDVYPWAGEIRQEEVGAMGLAMCRSQYVDQELDRVFKQIANKPLSTVDPNAAVATLAEHWGEMTMVHPFRDGNSRTQRLFFDQMMRNAGWAIDWTNVDSNEVHAGRYVAAATVDHTFLADALRPGVAPIGDVTTGTLAETTGNRDNHTSAELFHSMMRFKRSQPGKSFHDALESSQGLPQGTPPIGYTAQGNSAHRKEQSTPSVTPANNRTHEQAHHIEQGMDL